MSYSRNLLKILFLIALGAASVSCRKTPTVKTEKVPAVLSVQALSLDYEYSGSWDESDEIGVFVMKRGTIEVIEGQGNLRHIAGLSAGTASLVPAGDTIFFPLDGSAVDLIAYHPYIEMNAAQGYKYIIDLSDQDSPSPGMLTSAKAENHNSVMNSVKFTLKPRYAKIKVNLKIDRNETKAENSVDLSLCNLYFKGTYDIIGGLFQYSSEKCSSVLRRRQESVNVFEALLPPQIADVDAVLKVNLSADESKDVVIRDFIEEFKEGNQYDLDVIVSPEGIEASLVGVKAYYISDWKNDNDDLTGEIEQ